MSRALNPTTVRRLAIVRPKHLGDLLLTTPAFRSLRAGFPAAEIVLIGLPWAVDLVRRLPTLDRLIPFEGFPGMGEVDADPARLEPFLTRLRTEAFDLAVIFHAAGPSDAAFMAEIGARLTAGYTKPDTTTAFTVSLPFVDGVHEVHKNIALVRALGAPPVDDHLDFPLDATDDAAVDLLVPKNWRLPSAPPVVIHPSARAPARRWSLERFAQVADALIERAGARIIFVGTVAEREVADAIVDSMAWRDVVLNLTGKTTIGALAALIARAALFIGNDSGPNHLATAVGTPSVVISGPADPRRWRPLDPVRHRLLHHGAECSPCPHWECPIDHRCLRAITVDRVLEESMELLSTRVISPSQQSPA